MASLPATEKQVHPYWYQERTLDSKAPYIVMLGGTGGGKTWWGPLWLATRIAAHAEAGLGQGARYLAIGPTTDMVRDMMVPQLQDHFAGTYLQGRYQIDRNIYHLPTGGRIYLRSADKPYRIEGHHVRAVWADEPAQMKALIWPIIMARRAYYEGQVLLTGYPVAQNWYYHQIYLPWKRGDKRFDVIQFESTANPGYSKREFEAARNTLPPWLFEMRYLGQFRKPAGLVYPDFGDQCMVEPFEPPTDWPLLAAVDPGAYFGALLFAWRDGVYYAWRELYTEEVVGAAERAEEIAGILEGRRPGVWIYDPSRLQDITDLAEQGVGPFRPANNAVLAGIATLTGLIRQGRLKVMRGRCPNFVDQMERYSWPTDQGTGQRTGPLPIKAWDHLPDCARYLAHTLEGAPAETTETVTYYDPVRISPV